MYMLHTIRSNIHTLFFRVLTAIGCAKNICEYLVSTPSPENPFTASVSDVFFMFVHQSQYATASKKKEEERDANVAWKL